MMKKPPPFPAHLLLALLLISPNLPGCAAAPRPPAPPEPSAASRPSSAPLPPWGADPAVLYPRNSYLAAEGRGSNRDAADRNALANLAAFFGQSVQSDLRSFTADWKTALDGGAQAGFTEEVTEALRISVSMDSLLGAEIRERWEDGRGLCYALAVMEKAKALKLYTELFNSGRRVIDELTGLSPEEARSLDGAVKYRRAAPLADANAFLTRILSALDSPLDFSGVKTGEEYRNRAAGIIRDIPILVRLKNGEPDPVKNAFAAALTEAGFRTGGEGSRYTLEVDAVFQEALLDNPRYKWCAYEISADLTDTTTNTVLLPYAVHGRGGHLRYGDAERVALRDAEEKIRQSYGAALGEYLRRLLEGP
jgi:hypothetical protein